VLIEKDSGKLRINHLRIIHLFEADFIFFSNYNGVTGWFGELANWIYYTMGDMGQSHPGMH
jgi:hypothetical protein